MSEKDTGPTTPTIVEDDGWTLASGSSGGASESELLTALGAEPAKVDAAEKEAAAAEADAKAADDAAAVEASAGEETTPADPDEALLHPKTPRKRKAHDPQKRIDKMHAELEQERATRLRLENELQAIRRPSAPPSRPSAPPLRQPPIPPPLPPQALAAIGPRPTFGGEHGMEAQGKSYEEFEEARSEWDARRTRLEIDHALNTRLAEEQARNSVSRQAAAADAAFLSRIEAARRQRPDYDQVIENLGDLDSVFLKHLVYTSPDGPAIGLHLGEHPDQAQTLANMQFSRPVMDSLTRSRAPVRLLAHFAKHPEVIDQLHRMDPITAIVSIGRLEARLDVDHSVTTAAAPSVTRARPPLRTVSGGAPLARASSAALDADDIPLQDYILRENQAEAAKRQRMRGY